MEIIQQLIDFILHLDVHLVELATAYGVWIYAILFLIVFCETGLVVTPFLPGDSLLFAVGSLAALGATDLFTSVVLISLASISGDSTNYWIGRTIGPRIFHQEKSWLLNREYLDRTHRFYEKHGGKTIVIARFVPIIRTFAPFVAGIGRMRYGRFLLFSVGGSILWVSMFTFVGYFFGNLPFVKQNFSLVILALIIIPGMPAAIEFGRHILERMRRRRAAKNG